MSFAGTERLQGSLKRSAAPREFFRFSWLDVMTGGRVNKPVECVACLDRIITSGVQRHVAAQAPIHIHNVTLGYFEAFRNCLDLIRSHSSVVECRNGALGLPQFENNFFCAELAEIFTSDHDRRTYSWIVAFIHHIA